MGKVVSSFGLVVTPLLTVLFLMGALLLQQKYLPNLMVGSRAPTVSVTPPIPVVVTSTLSYGDALHTYETIASSAIEASKTSLEMMRWLISALLLLVAGAGGAAAYVYRTANEAIEKAKSAEESADVAQKAATRLSNSYNQLRQQHVNISEQHYELRGKTTSLTETLERWGKGQIPVREVLEAQQWHSWSKWAHGQNQQGWEELAEQKKQEGDLTDLITGAMEVELMKIEVRVDNGQTLSEQDLEYQRRLRDLIE